VHTAGGEKILVLQSQSGEEDLHVDEILVGVGRKPNVESLGLEAAGVAYDHHGVSIDDFFRTTNRRIYASGDVCLPCKFTHTADATSRAVIQNALFPWPKKRLSRLVIPWCTYTDPEIAHVGKYADQAEAEGIQVETWEVAMADVDRAVTDGETEGFLKVHCQKGTDTIVGATLVGEHAGDMISEISTAMAAGMGLGSFSGVIHPYPTRAEIIRKAADAYNRERLTPRVNKLLRKWFEFTR
jgi:pyruvate/2-oxoglutarate dehydrogenase complex dihydrolipoamide dehydrogenase (E3) component